MNDSGKTILRQHRRDYFVQVPNDTARDKNLSWKATGLLCYLLSLPDNWEINLAHLASAKKDGRDGTRAGMRELEEFCYLKKDVLRDDSGRIVGTQWTVSDYPLSENPKTDNPLSENPTQRRKALKKKDLSIKEEEQPTSRPVDNPELSDTDVKKLFEGRGLIFKNQQDVHTCRVELLPFLESRPDLISNVISTIRGRATKKMPFPSQVVNEVKGMLNKELAIRSSEEAARRSGWRT